MPDAMYNPFMDTITGNVASAPVLVATGNGQLVLLALGGDHRLYHWRFAGNSWKNCAVR